MLCSVRLYTMRLYVIFVCFAYVLCSVIASNTTYLLETLEDPRGSNGTESAKGGRNKRSLLFKETIYDSLSLMDQISQYPRLVILDLDNTLWKFKVDDDVYKPPFKKDKHGKIFDSRRREVVICKDTVKVFKFLFSKRILPTVVSTCTNTKIAEKLLAIHDVDKYIRYKLLAPDDKLLHLKRIAYKFALPGTEILFLDDEQSYVDAAIQLGIISYHVPNGLSIATLIKALKFYSDLRFRPPPKDTF